MKETDKAWTAGIFDGEAYLLVAKRTYGIQVANTDKRMLEKLQTLWGGNIHLRKQRANRPNDRPCWTWDIYGRKNAYPCVLAVLRYLIVKKEKAEEIVLYEINRSDKKLIRVVAED